MDHRQIARTLASARVVIGAALLVAPGLLGGRWLGGEKLDRRARLVVRSLGARDLALAIGTLRALDQGTPVRSWVTLAAFGDAVDAAGAALAWPTLGPARAAFTIASATAAAALGAVAASELD